MSYTNIWGGGGGESGVAIYIYTISRHNVHCGIQPISSQNNILIHQCIVVLTK